MSSDLRTELRAGVLWATMIRPDVHNALDPELIGALHYLFESAARDPAVRVVVLTGAGASFCSGADLAWMRRSAELSYEQNLADAEQLAGLYAAIEQCPRPVLARVQGSAFGGGAGLAAAADITVAAAAAMFAFSEVRLGVIPAVIAPYVLRRVGEGAARRLFLTGTRITAAEAQTLGLVHRVARPDELDRAVDEEVRALLAGGPQAQADVKELLLALRGVNGEEAARQTARRIAASRTAPEGQAGLRAFLEKRPAPWQGERRVS